MYLIVAYVRLDLFFRVSNMFLFICMLSELCARVRKQKA